MAVLEGEPSKLIDAFVEAALDRESRQGLDELGGEEEQEEDSSGEARGPLLPDLEPLLGGLHALRSVLERLLKLKRLSLERPLELAGLERLTLAELPQEVPLKMSDLTQELHHRVLDNVGRDGRPAVRRHGCLRLALLRPAAVFVLEERATGGTEEGTIRSAGGAHRARASGGR